MSTARPKRASPSAGPTTSQRETPSCSTASWRRTRSASPSPINRARRVVLDLVESGRVRRSWVGAEVEPVQVPGEGLRRVRDVRVEALRDFQLVTLTPAIQAERGMANSQGALIVGLSEAARGHGLQEGDLILQINRGR